MWFSLFKKRDNSKYSLSKLDLDDVNKVDVTIILNLWKRNYFEEQMTALLNQSVLPTEIWVIHYENHINIQERINEFKDLFPNIILISSDKNLMYFGRFSIAINTNTKYIWFLDDDIIPGKFYLENSTISCQKNNSIISCAGRIIPKNNFRPEQFDSTNYKNVFVGDVNKKKDYNYNPTEQLVDYGCQSYFLKKEWLAAFWSIWPTTFMSGEDIHLSATCKTRLNVNTMVIEQTELSNTGNMKKFYGRDSKASYKKFDFVDIREKVIEHHIQDNGWQPLNW